MMKYDEKFINKQEAAILLFKNSESTSMKNGKSYYYKVENPSNFDENF